MDRRQFLKLSAALGSTAALPYSLHLNAQQVNYEGKFLVTIQAQGAWDTASFCDPKMNVAGELDINNWANSNEIQTAGNIQYAPFADNQAFFDKYHRDMMVINGIDYQTNSHTAGETHAWSGRISAGFPTLTSLFALQNGDSLPLAYVNNGGYGETAGLTRYTRLESSGALDRIINPNQLQWDKHTNYINPDQWDLVSQYQQSREQLVNGMATVSDKMKHGRIGYRQAIENSSLMGQFGNAVENAGTLEEPTEGQFWNSLNLQAQLAALAMSSGVCVAADLIIGGYDTHQNHDTDQSTVLTQLTQGIDKLWEYAELYGIADRLIVVIGSDFSRTPHYNDDNGKDHWPVGSMIIMEKNTSWGNRMVGATDGGLFNKKINPNTLEVDEANGSSIYPKHVMDSFRGYLGLNEMTETTLFPFNNSESFDFFNANKSTPQMSDPRNTVRI